MKTVNPNKSYEDWVNRKWRPAVAWAYIVICLFDFLVAPVITFYFFGRYSSGNYTQWQPITLVGSGLFHVAMGAIIGVTAWQRGTEKVERYRNEREQYGPRPYRSRETYEDQADYRSRALESERPYD